MKPINYDFSNVQNLLATKIANLEVQLANEQIQSKNEGGENE